MLIAIILVCTSVYAAVTATIDVTPSSASVKRGDTVTVTLSLKDVDSSKKVESVEGYINYNKNVIEPITVNSIQKNSDNTVTIGSERLKVEDLTNKTVEEISLSSAYVAFNGNPRTDNDSRIVIDFENGLTSNTDLLKIDFKVKSDATLGVISDAIAYEMFVITAGSEESREVTEKVELTVSAATPVDPTDPTDPTDPVEKTLSEISITTAPTKTTYTEGEKFDKSGMVITAKYSDGTTKNVTNYTITPSGNLTTSDTRVTISYSEGTVTKQITQPITVKANSGTTNNTVNNTTNNTIKNTVNNVVNNTTNNTAKNTTNNTTNNTTRNTTNNTTNKTVNNTNKVDNSTTTKSIPATGAKMLLVPVLVVIILTYISYNRYMKYKDI